VTPAVADPTKKKKKKTVILIPLLGS
jgi:hypothetical protein